MALRSVEKPHYVGHRRRLKDRFIKAGLEPFADYEVLEFLLTFSIAQKDVKPVAKELIDRFKSFQGVLDAPLDAVTSVQGVGEHSALLIKLAKACSDYYLRRKLHGKSIISSPEDLLNYCKSAMAGQSDEQFRIVYLNAKNEVLHDELLQEGTVDQSAVYPRKIIERALRQKAVALILVHNHPSGNPEPSSHDRHLTKMLIQLSESLGIKIHDHIIIGRNEYFSFRYSKSYLTN
jgi:DNA repair protein RadC